MVDPVPPNSLLKHLVHATRELGLVLLIVVLSLSSVSILVPAPFEIEPAESPWLRFLLAVARQPVVLAVGFFLLLLGIVQYWRRTEGERRKPPLRERGRSVGQQIVGESEPVDAEGPPLELEAEILPSRVQMPSQASRRPSPLLARPWSSAGAALAIVGVALVARRCLVETAEVASSSMLPTLDPGDHLLVNRIAYGVPIIGRPLPRRGDIIVFRTAGLMLLPGTAENVGQLTKRVIGLPGDEIAMERGHPVINGWRVPGCRIGEHTLVDARGRFSGDLFVEWLEGSPFLVLATHRERFRGRYRVRPGEVFVLGDLRENSTDSRAWNLAKGGGVETESIVGRVEHVIVGRKRSGRPDWARALAPLELGLRTENVDTTRLEEDLAACLAVPPKETTPPPGDPETPFESDARLAPAAIPPGPPSASPR